MDWRIEGEYIVGSLKKGERKEERGEISKEERKVGKKRKGRKNISKIEKKIMNLKSNTSGRTTESWGSNAPGGSDLAGGANVPGRSYDALLSLGCQNLNRK